MRQCPKCGYVDPPYWRHSRYSYWIDFTEYENWLYMGFPEIQKGQKYEDEYFVYRRNKTGRKVHRKAKIDYGEQWNIPMEKAHKYPMMDKRKYWTRDPKQKTLH